MIVHSQVRAFVTYIASLVRWFLSLSLHQRDDVVDRSLELHRTLHSEQSLLRPHLVAWCVSDDVAALSPNR